MERDTEPEFERSLTRELRLSRRRSRLPWVYSVYHRPPTAYPHLAVLTTSMRGRGVQSSPVETTRPQSGQTIAQTGEASEAAPRYVCRRRKAGTSRGELASNTFSPADTPGVLVPRLESDSSTSGRRLTPTVGGAPD